MCKFNPKNDARRMDPCMKEIIESLNVGNVIETLGCCCGHGKYPKTIIIRNKEGLIYELISFKMIPRKKRFYKKDKQGYYYIPETLNKRS